MLRFCFFFAILACGVLRADIDGLYVSNGYNPYTKSNYSGSVIIKKDKNGVYQSEWSLGEKKYTGTGMMTDDELCFVSVGPSKVPGEEYEVLLTTYTIKGNKLIGEWVIMGQSLIGTGTLTKKE